MPTYGATTYRAGFYNNKIVNGTDDRVYTAEDMREPFNTVYSKGVLPAEDGTAGDTLKVTSTGGMSVAVASGNANLGAWFTNEGAFYITLDNATGTARYDAIIIRSDDNDAVRAPSIYVKSLTKIPTVADLTRDERIYEICVAYVKVAALAEAITDADIVDTREDGSLCNVMSGVGAVVTRTFHNTYFSEAANQTVIPIGISNYNRTRDELSVIVEGRVFAEGTHYTIDNNSQITLAIGLPVVGTRVAFEVAKNVNAAGADTVVQEVGELLNDMASVKKTLEHHYYCNGLTDNVNISDRISAFQSGFTDYGSMKLVIHGTFGATSPKGGAGTVENPYYWIRAAQGGLSSRKVTLDFTDCRAMSFNCEAGTNNIIFFGMDVRVIGANVIATGGATITMFSSAGGTAVFAENCRFWITCESGGYIARSGTFKNCRASVTNAGLHSYCFAPMAASLLRIEGGEYYAYTGSADHVSAVVGATSGTSAVAILYGVNAPTVARSGFYQTHAVYQTTGWICSTDLISALPLNVVSGISNVRGTIALSKAGLM